MDDTHEPYTGVQEHWLNSGNQPEKHAVVMGGGGDSTVLTLARKALTLARKEHIKYSNLPNFSTL